MSTCIHGKPLDMTPEEQCQPCIDLIAEEVRRTEWLDSLTRFTKFFHDHPDFIPEHGARVFMRHGRYFDDTPEHVAEARTAVFDLIEAAGDKIEVPPEVGDPEFAKGAAGKFHELGLTKDQGEKLASWWNEQIGGKVALSKTEAANRLVKEQGELATEWGAAYTQSTAQAQAAVRALGLNAETITQLESVLGFKATMNLFQKVGSKTGEAAFVGGDGPAPLGSALTPEGAQARIQELKVDKGFQAKLKGKDVNALAEWSRLFTFAYPEPVK